MAKAFSGKKPQHFGNTIRVFLNYLGRHKFMLGLVGVLTAVSALANLLGTYMIKPVVNGILETGSIPGLVRGVALTAAIYAVGALSTLGYTQTMVRAAQKVLHDIRRDLFAHLQTLPLSFFDSRRNGELMSLFTNDVDTISDALNNSFALLIQSFIQVVGTLVLLFVLNWRLSQFFDHLGNTFLDHAALGFCNLVFLSRTVPGGFFFALVIDGGNFFRLAAYLSFAVFIRFPFQFSETIIKIKNRLFISSFVFFGRSLPLCIV